MLILSWMMFDSLKESREKGVRNLPVVQEFPEVFPYDITDFTAGEGSWVCNWFGARNESYFNCAVSDVCIRVGWVEEAVGSVTREVVH